MKLEACATKWTPGDGTETAVPQQIVADTVPLGEARFAREILLGIEKIEIFVAESNVKWPASFSPG
jgi:hypothetical protein